MVLMGEIPDVFTCRVVFTDPEDLVLADEVQSDGDVHTWKHYPRDGGEYALVQQHGHVGSDGLLGHAVYHDVRFDIGLLMHVHQTDALSRMVFMESRCDPDHERHGIPHAYQQTVLVRCDVLADA